MKDQLIINPLEATEPLIGSWLAYLEDDRKRTKETVEVTTSAQLEWSSAEHPNSIESLLYHIAAIEADWLYAEILEQDIPDDLMKHFPFDVGDKEGKLSEVRAWSLTQYLDVLGKTRACFSKELKLMTLKDFKRIRSFEPYDVTPEWVCLSSTRPPIAGKSRPSCSLCPDKPCVLINPVS